MPDAAGWGFVIIIVALCAMGATMVWVLAKYWGPQASADARLIAVAPELLSLLRAAESVIRQGAHLNSEWLAETQTVIAKVVSKS